MERTKRQRNDTIQVYNSTKKRKLQNEITIINRNKSLFEDLPNEIIYELFEYLDFYHVHEGFFNLNNRFQNLLINSTLPIKMNISTISKSNFEFYHKNLILPHKHRINILRLSNPFTLDIIFSPPRIISKFIQLERLILDNIKSKYLNNILNHLIRLPKLHSLVLTLHECVKDATNLFFYLFRLSKLKYCKLTYQTDKYLLPLPIDFDKCERSPIEHLVINGRFRFDSFNYLLFFLPQLRRLSIHCLIESHNIDMELSPIELEHLKYVSLDLSSVRFERFQISIKHFFRSIQVLRLITKSDPTYLDAKRWEPLILSSMPNLRIFDLNHDNIESIDNHFINQFTSPLWVKNQWFFTQQNDWQEKFESGLFYSIDPHQKKDMFYWALEKQLRPQDLAKNFNSDQHVHICGRRTTIKNCVNYFPNITELTIEHYFKTSEYSISTILNRMISLEQLTKLDFQIFNFPFHKLIELLRFTPSLHALKLNALSLYETNLILIEQSEHFHHVSKTNKIKKLNFREHCTLEKLHWIVSLFPQVEYLKIKMNRKDMLPMTQFLLSKTNNQIRHLGFLCIAQTPKLWFPEIKRLIKLENLLEDYFIKLINQDLYLWW